MTKKLLTFTFWLLLGLPMLAGAQNKPDLVIVAPFSLPTTVQPGSQYPMSAVIKNQGTNGSQFNCIGFYLSTDRAWDAGDAYLGSSCQSLIFPGQSGPCSITGTIPSAAPGSYYLVLVADPLNAEQELDETNNVVSFNVAVTTSNGSLPDLELWRPSLSFAAVPPGGSTGVFTFIFNRGPGAAPAYEIGFYLSADTVFSANTDVFLGQVTGSLSLPSGTIHSAPVLTVPRTTVPGDYYLVLMADPRNALAETNENNNSRALPLRVTGPTAARVAAAKAAVQLYPNPVASGAPLTIRWDDAGKGSPVVLTLYDALGRATLRQTGRAGQETRLDTRGLLSGVYTLHLSEAGRHVTQRVIIN